MRRRPAGCCIILSGDIYACIIILTYIVVFCYVVYWLVFLFFQQEYSSIVCAITTPIVYNPHFQHSVNLSDKRFRMEAIKRGYSNDTFGTETESVC